MTSDLSVAELRIEAVSSISCINVDTPENKNNQTSAFKSFEILGGEDA